MLFYNSWKKENNLSDEDLKKSNPAVLYTLSTVLSFVICYNLAFFLGDDGTDAAWGATAGLLAGFGWSAMIFCIIALFEQKSVKYMLINSGYIIVYFTLAGLIIGAWR